jgi:CDP-glycerol glycerophosphotransferase
MIKATAKILALSVARVVLKLLWVLPIKQNRIVFSSYNGSKYSCNPKYLYEYLRRTGVDFEYVWVLDNGATELDLLQDSRLVKTGTFKYLYFIMTCKVFVTNDGFGAYIPFRDAQLVINTWHGGGVYKSSGLGGNSQLSYADVVSLRHMSHSLTWFVSSSKAFSENMAKYYLIPDYKFLPTGMPRNDLLFQRSGYIDYADNVKQELGLDNELKLVLYTPTFRGKVQEGNNDFELDVRRLLLSLEKKFGGKFALLYRVHHSVKDIKKRDNVLDVSAYPDVQVLLAAVDVLISDYSSILWDYSLTNKPCFVFAPDFASYTSQDRGFSSKAETWPFPIAIDNDTLDSNIQAFEQLRYNSALDDHYSHLVSYENGNAAQSISDLIVKSL